MEILPLNAFVYNQDRVNMQDVVAPPYDVINSDYQEDLYSRSEYNIIRLILSKSDNRYEDAKQSFVDWKEKKVLIKTEKPSIFYIVQRYQNVNGRIIERKGFIARNKIEDFSTKKILPHEYTMGEPKQDRLNLVTATGAFFSQIFMVYNDEMQIIEQKISSKYRHRTPFIDVTDDYGVQNLVWIIDDKDDIQVFQQALKNKTLLIADGHHRYETAMNYSRINPDNDDAKYVMSYFTNAADENLVIYPTHRIIEKDINPKFLLNTVANYYDIEVVNDRNEFLSLIEKENQKQITTGLILKEDKNFYVLKLKESSKKLVDVPEVLKNLDLIMLHELILKRELGFSEDELFGQINIKYEKQEAIAFDSVKLGASACFIMAYPKMQDVLAIASQGYRMPQKSTYFYPKLLSGIAINQLN